MSNGFLLKGKSDEYQNTVDLLTTCLNNMMDLKGRMQAHVNSVTDVIDEADANFDNARELCQQNVVSLDIAIRETEKRREAVQVALTEMTGLSGKVESTISTAIGTVASLITTATNAAKVLD